MTGLAYAIDPREASRVVEQAIRDKSYRQYPLGQEAGRYLRAKRKRLTETSYRDYESALDKLARYFMHAELTEFDLPDATDRLERFLDDQWGHRAARTYNKSLSVIHDFFKWQCLRGNLHGDPTLPIERARKGDVYRTTFDPDQVRSIIASQADLRDRVAVRLLLDYGLRKGALRAIQYQHFDHYRKRLTIFTKGRKVRNLRILHQAFWFDLERLIVETEAQPWHYLLQRQKAIPHKGETRMHRFPELPMGEHGAHNWWYARLTDAGVVAEGTTRGEKMHKARHTAGQRVLDETGNLKAVQKLLGHSSIQTTGDTYTDWDEEQLAQTMLSVVEDEA